ncbi:MAG: DUF3866 family protein [Firmicutes bacterium]|nr:DUF3866 family protein [Bacillota bacterium]
MIHWRKGRVLRVLRERRGLQEVAVATPEGEGKAVILTDLLGRVAPGDEVVLHVTAVAVGLGTGGRHFVAAVECRLTPDPVSPGHLMKLRYTPFQLRCHTPEEDGDELPEDLAGGVVVVGELHSQLLPAALSLRRVLGPRARLVYLMTDGGALPLAISDLVAAMREKGLLDATVTVGHAFGGDLEALNIYAGLLSARHLLAADVILVMMGPGIAGTGSRFDHTGVEQAHNADAVGILGGRTVLIPRLSFRDPRARHYGLSHHSLTVFGRLTKRRALLPLPVLPGPALDLLFRQLTAEGIHRKHDLILVEAGEVLDWLRDCGIEAKTMGRGPEDDPGFFLAAGAAGLLAAQIHLREGKKE